MRNLIIHRGWGVLAKLTQCDSLQTLRRAQKKVRYLIKVWSSKELVLRSGEIWTNLKTLNEISCYLFTMRNHELCGLERSFSQNSLKSHWCTYPNTIYTVSIMLTSLLNQETVHTYMYTHIFLCSLILFSIDQKYSFMDYIIMF